MLRNFREVWVLDFEFQGADGERPDPLCLVAKEVRSGRLVRLWREDLRALRRSPIPTDSDVLHAAYFSSAEWTCYLALGWPLPVSVVDPFVEHRVLTNGIPKSTNDSLLGAAAHWRIDTMVAGKKDAMRTLILENSSWSDAEREDIIDYCGADVETTEKLLLKIEGKIDWPRAVGVRGRYMMAVARMQDTGIPFDMEIFPKARDQWERVKTELVNRVDRDFGVYDGVTFKHDRFAAYLNREGIPWPTTPSGRLALDEETWKDGARTFPILQPLRELQNTMSALKLKDFSIGSDGRNRVLLSPFRSATGRNQPSNSRFVFGAAKWTRHFIKPPPDRALVVLDYSQQEFLLAGALSGDPAMIAAYKSGDAYMTAAIQAGLAPEGATKASHPRERELFKVASLAVLYGMGEASLAARLGKPTHFARQLLRKHRETYRTYWRWSDGIADCAALHGMLRTPYGWAWNVGSGARQPQIRNWPIQSAGADVMRLASIYLISTGIAVNCPVHDAFLVEVEIEKAEEIAIKSKMLMTKAASDVTGGIPILAEAKIIKYPNRYEEAKGKKIWETVLEVLGIPHAPTPHLPPSMHPTPI